MEAVKHSSVIVLSQRSCGENAIEPRRDPSLTHLLSLAAAKGEARSVPAAAGTSCPLTWRALAWACAILLERRACVGRSSAAELVAWWQETVVVCGMEVVEASAVPWATRAAAAWVVVRSTSFGAERVLAPSVSLLGGG